MAIVMNSYMSWKNLNSMIEPVFEPEKIECSKQREVTHRQPEFVSIFRIDHGPSILSKAKSPEGKYQASQA
jgi:hypothetical protein